jgi:hypothetical protein
MEFFSGDEGRTDMTTPPSMQRGSGWQRHFFYRKESIKTTWKLRLAVLTLVVLLVLMTRGFWSLRIVQSLVCTENLGPSDVILVENFEPDYFIFERAAVLHQTGWASRLLVPTSAAVDDPKKLSGVGRGLVEVMVRESRMEAPELLPIREIEPISLNTAYQVRDFLTKGHLRSVIVVTHGLRSQRSFLIYHMVLAPAGIQVYCVPVFGDKTKTPTTWMTTWHGIQDVIEQFLKLQYYRFHVLRNHSA